MKYKSLDIINKQMEIIEKYQASKEFLKNLEKSLDKNDADLRSGKISRENYVKNLEYFTSIDFVKDSLLESDMTDYKNQYIALEEQEEKEL